MLQLVLSADQVAGIDAADTPLVDPKLDGTASLRAMPLTEASGEADTLMMTRLTVVLDEADRLIAMPLTGGLDDADTWMAMPLTESKRLAAAEFERRYLIRVMARAGGSVSGGARLSGLDRTNFRRLLQRHGLHGASLPQRGVPFLEP